MKIIKALCHFELSAPKTLDVQENRKMSLENGLFGKNMRFSINQ